MISRWAAEASDAGELAAELGRMNREGLSYTDLEALEYEFPRPNAEPPDKKGR